MLVSFTEGIKNGKRALKANITMSAWGHAGFQAFYTFHSQVQRSKKKLLPKSGASGQPKLAHPLRDDGRWKPKHLIWRL